MTQLSSLPVVVGIDGSDSALAAARWAAALARREHARLRLVHAYELPLGFPSGMTREESVLNTMREQGRDWLTAAQRVVAEVDPGLSTDIVLESAPVANVLLYESRSAQALVLGTRGRSALTGLLVGCTSVAVAGQARCPVVVVRGTEQEAGPVVVGVDGTPVSESAVAYGFAEASARGVDLVAVHAWTESLLEATFAGGAKLIDVEGLRQQAEATLTARLAPWRDKYPDVRVTRDVAHERPGRALERHAATAQLVVVGRRGRGGFRSLILGSTSQHLLHHARCPVAVVRTPE